MHLVSPSIIFKDSYHRYITELGTEERYPFTLDLPYDNFEALLKRLEQFELGENLPEGSVKSSTYWLIEQQEIIGVTNIRHYLNERIMHCGGHIGLGVKPSYRSKGIGRLLMQESINMLTKKGVNPIHIHCYKDNLASVNTIVKNNGKLISEITEQGKIIQRYIVENLSL